VIRSQRSPYATSLLGAGTVHHINRVTSHCGKKSEYFRGQTTVKSIAGIPIGA
jgi:hypothetical protein